MNETLKHIPEFASEAEECEFWKTHDPTEYFDWSARKPVQGLIRRGNPEFATVLKVIRALG